MNRKGINIVRFHSEDIITNVPTCCLIEDYWTLHTALAAIDGCDLAQAREQINTAMECLAENIDRFTSVKAGLNIRPSVCSVIAMSCESGIVMDGDDDLKCRAGRPVSEAGINYCGACPHSNECDPDEGSILLEGDVRYETWGYPSMQDDGKFLETLNDAMLIKGTNDASQAENQKVLAWVDGALCHYGTDDLSVDLNEKGMIDVNICTNRYSDIYKSDVAQYDRCNIKKLEEELDKRNVGHCW